MSRKECDSEMPSVCFEGIKGVRMKGKLVVSPDSTMPYVYFKGREASPRQEAPLGGRRVC